MKKQIIKRKILSEKGGAAVLVFFTVFTFLVVLSSAYMSVSILRKSQLKSDIQIQEVYERDYKGVDNLYEELSNRGSYDIPYIPKGFSHIGEEDWNNGYRISDTGDETGNIFVWVPCTTDKTKVKEGDQIVLFEKTMPTVKDDGTIDDTDPYYVYNKNNYTITDQQGTTEEIEESVEKYGGFYIAAYEAGIEDSQENYDTSTNMVKTATDGSVKPLSKPGKGVWNYITRADAITISKSMVNSSETGVKSALMTGACWDTTLRWMVQSSENAKKEPNLGYDINPTEKGWHSDVSSNTRHTTGYFAVNNIYDMAGNIWEWTTENSTDNVHDYVISRGGYYGYSASFYPTAYRALSGDAIKDFIGFRVVLYK